jgi:hypothetical protein
MKFSQVVEREQLERNQKGKILGKTEEIKQFLATDQYKTGTMTTIQIAILS